MKAKRIVALFVTAFLAVSLFTACSNTDHVEGSAYFNSEYADSGMETINGSAFDYENSTLSEQGGFGIHLPQVIQSMTENGLLSVFPSEYSTNMIYWTEQQKEMLSIFAVLRVRQDDENTKSELERVKKFYANIDTLAVVEGDTYYFAYNDDFSDFSLSDADKENIDEILSAKEALKDGICLFPAKEITISSAVNMNDFNTKTLDGEVFTQDDLGKYDLTMVNVWTTWCGPCVDELPELQKLYEMLPDNANLITICADANEEMELANKIVQELNCSFKVLIADSKLQESLLAEVTGYPTTIFVDSNGNMIGEAQIGVPGSKENIVENYLRMIEERLDTEGNDEWAGV